jgi:hypothetical protein
MASLIPSANASGTGSMTLAGPSTNSNQTVNIPDTTGTMMVSGNMPAFSAYKSSGSGNQSITSATYTKVTFDTEEFDTNSNFLSSTFTPTVAGYYQVNGALDVGASATTLSRIQISIYKNGGSYKTTAISYGGTVATEQGPSISTIVYCNGSTDYIEMWVYAVGTSPIVYPSSVTTWFSGCMVRSA